MKVAVRWEQLPEGGSWGLQAVEASGNDGHQILHGNCILSVTNYNGTKAEYSPITESPFAR